MTSISQLKVKNMLEQTLEQAFPSVSPGVRPFGSQVLVQFKNAAMKTSAGIILTNETVDTEFDNTQVAKVISLGDGAYKSRTTLEPWPEGDWVKPGMYVRVPKYGGDRWSRPKPGTDGRGKENVVTFALFDDLLMKGEVDDPLAMQAFL